MTEPRLIPEHIDRRHNPLAGNPLLATPAGDPPVLAVWVQILIPPGLSHAQADRVVDEIRARLAMPGLAGQWPIKLTTASSGTAWTATKAGGEPRG